MGKFSTALEKGEQEDSYTQESNGDWLQPEKSEIQKQSSPNQPHPADLNIQTISNPWDPRLFKAINQDISLPEIFKVLRSRILHPQNSDRPIRSVMITSAVPKEGKSFITANLGISLAQGMDQHSLLVDCDLRQPSLAKLFGISGTLGLVDYLRDNSPLPDLINKTAVNKLSIIASGKPPLNPAELLSSAKMKELARELSKRYDDRIIIFDTPPIMVAAESSVLASHVDGVILVVREGMSRKNEIQKTIDSIGKNKILGMVYNGQTSNIIDKSYSKRYDYYHHE
ncbi:MAG: protein-tyrosine kinase [Desulforhopalus sp.]|jgi:protein-tyrosine kinase